MPKPRSDILSSKMKLMVANSINGTESRIKSDSSSEARSKYESKALEESRYAQNTSENSRPRISNNVRFYKSLL